MKREDACQALHVESLKVIPRLASRKSEFFLPDPLRSDINPVLSFHRARLKKLFECVKRTKVT
jgi:hypothetical protein